MESGSESEAISSVNPLLTLALGASEEVNTTSNADKNSYLLRSKTTTSSDKPMKDSMEEFAHSTPLNSPIVGCASSTTCTVPCTSNNVIVQQNVNELEVRVIPSTDVDLNPVFCTENLHLVQVQEDTCSGVSNGETENVESAPIPGGFVMIEQSVLEQISGFLKNATLIPSGGVSKISNTVTATTAMQDQDGILPNSTTNGTQTDSDGVTDTSRQQLIQDGDDDWIDTKATALHLTDELRRYHIPQAVFARKVLNRSQGTLSDILRKPKPWNEMRLGKEIFRRMKEWLSLPEVKRIPQLRTEAAKELDSRHKRHIEEPDDIMQDPDNAPKKVRRQFTESQKRSLFAIFKETKKPTKEMQRAIAEELGLDLTTVSNFFMNARRRHSN
ncbi:hypothetical protein QZH41_017984 [Actinostola sp. cb2023]|nr:hypothetical protein QZH41_017984 [Actinostola sp. cb2023]